MFAFDSNVFVPMMIFALPIIAVAGGITAGIVKTISRHRLMELAQRERIAAIERGIDPNKLPPMTAMMSDSGDAPTYMTFRQASIHRSRGLLVGGIITLATGIGLSVMLYFVAGSSEDQNAWAIGAIPALIGVALLISSFVYRRFADEDDERPRKS
jgi:hypothetical protein